MSIVFTVSIGGLPVLPVTSIQTRYETAPSTGVHSKTGLSDVIPPIGPMITGASGAARTGRTASGAKDPAIRRIEASAVNDLRRPTWIVLPHRSAFGRHPVGTIRRYSMDAAWSILPGPSRRVGDAAAVSRGTAEPDAMNQRAIRFGLRR